jgi:hypothetical protein
VMMPLPLTAHPRRRRPFPSPRRRTAPPAIEARARPPYQSVLTQPRGQPAPPPPFSATELPWSGYPSDFRLLPLVRNPNLLVWIFLVSFISPLADCRLYPCV